MVVIRFKMWQIQKINSTLEEETNGNKIYLHFEALGTTEIKCKIAVEKLRSCPSFLTIVILSFCMANIMKLEII